MFKSLVLVGAFASLALVPGAAIAKANDADRAFLTQDVQGGRYELALAKMAVTKAKAPAVRTYAQEIVRDHESANAALMKLAQQEGVNAPGGMAAKDSETLTRMQGLSGAAFDTAYVDEMVRINAEDEQTAKKEKDLTSESGIKAYLNKFAAMDAKHKAGAMKLKSAG